MNTFFSFKEPVHHTIVIKKSEFITDLISVQNEDEIEAALKKIKKDYYDATHHCYAYILGTGIDNHYKCSDDGEPSKTAGAPILDSLQKNNLTNCLCVVTRYFGGIKLGAGGLVRAYSESASEAIKKITDLNEIIEKSLLLFTVSYDYVNTVLKVMGNYTLKRKEFLEKASFSYELPSSVLNEVKEKLINQTNGKVSFSESNNN